MSAVSSPELVCFGNFTIDDVVLPNGTERLGCTGGDALYAALAARNWLPATELVAPIGADLPAHIIAQMAQAGLSMAGMAQRDLPTLHNRVVYQANGDRTWTLFATQGAFDVLSPLPADIPASYLGAKAFMILAMTLGAQQRLVSHLRKIEGAVIALDPQEDYMAGNEAQLRAMIGQTDIFLPSAEEVRRLLGTDDWSAAARSFSALGPRIVVIKLGADGCLVYDRNNDSKFTLPAYPGAEVIDTTGAGDSFCGAFMAAYLLNPSDLHGAAKAGTVAASFTVSGYGADPLFQTNRALMQQRLQSWSA